MVVSPKSNKKDPIKALIERTRRLIRLCRCGDKPSDDRKFSLPRAAFSGASNGIIANGQSIVNDYAELFTSFFGKKARKRRL